MNAFLYLLLISSLVLTSCKPQSDEETNELLPADDAEEGDVEEETPEEDAEETAQYEDGTYTEMGTYISPAGPEQIEVTLELREGEVVGVNVVPQATNEVSVKLQGLFVAGIGAEVIGMPLEEVGPFSSVNGSSLTPKGFMDAVERIKEEASLDA